MYNYDIIEEARRNNLLFLLSNKGLFPYIKNDVIFIRHRTKIVFRKNVSDFGVNDVSDILGISIVDSVYAYYFLDIARDNGASTKSYSKKKSLGL